MKSPYDKILRYSLAATWYLVVALLVFAALVLTTARILLPMATDYKADIEAIITEVLHQPVEIQQLSASWQGFEPQLVLDGVKFYTPDKTKLINEFAHARIGINLFSSLLRMTVVPGALIVEGTQLIVVRDKDGRVRIEGFGDSDKPLSDEEQRLLADWILDQRLLHVRKTRVTFRDQVKNGRRFEFPNITFTIRNRGQQHQIDGAALLPATLGAQLAFQFDLRGNFLLSDAWSGNGYITGGGLRMTEWLRALEQDAPYLQNGIASVNLWTRWQSARLEDVRGNVTVNSLTLRSSDTARLVKFDHVGGNFAVDMRPEEWRVTGDHFVVTSGDARWPATRFDVRYRTGSKNLEGELGYVDMADATRLMLIAGINDDSLEDMLRTMKLGGQLENIVFYLQPREDSAPAFAASGRFRAVDMQPWKDIPGIKGVNGDFMVSNDDGFVNFDTENWKFDYPAMFRTSLPLNFLRGAVSWHREAEGWRVDSRRLDVASDLMRVWGRFGIDVVPGQSPFLDIAVSLQSNNMGAAGLYLPAKIMSPQVVEWIDTAIRSGRFNEGGLLYYGRPADYPFNDQQGRFNLYLNAENVNLVYLPNWPDIEGIDGEFNLTSKGLEFLGASGRIYSNVIRSVYVKIPDFFAEEVALDIIGVVDGFTQEKLNYLHASPLEQMFAEGLRPFHAQGTSLLDLDLHIPLGAKGKFRVNGELRARRNRFFAEEYKLDIRDLNVDIAFDEEGIYSRKVTGQLGPIPLSPKIDTIKGRRMNDLVIRQEILLDKEQIQYVLDHYLGEPQWAKPIRGAVNSIVELSIPIVKDKRLVKPVSISLWSDMLGTAIDLPTPAHKEALDNKPLFLRYELSGSTRNFVSTFGDISVVLETQATKTKTVLSRGVLAFNDGPVLPTENGIHFYGAVDRFSWSEWDSVLFGPSAKEGLIGEGGGSGNPLYIDVKIGELEVFGARFNQLALNASSATTGWTFHPDGPEIAGTIFVPAVIKNTPLVFDMSRLYLNIPEATEAVAEKDKKALSPAEFPPAKIKAKNFRYNKKEFGALELNASVINNGIHLDKFVLAGPVSRIEASGDWTEDDKHRQFSSFNIQINAKNFGDTLGMWSYGKILKGGDGNLIINASWPGSPADFAFKNLTGKLAVRMNNVHIIDVNVGAIKMLGLFSLQALPRRIFLDFSDLTNKGLRFDSIEGFFDVQRGDAFTSGLLLLGPTGKLGLAGRIGLAAEDFDLVLTFVPGGLETIPILGGLAAADPTLTGATIFAFQKLFQSQFDDISTVQYTVRDTWASPKIERVGVQVKPPVDLLNEQ